MFQRTYLVVPFERVGSKIGPRQAFLFGEPRQARIAASQLATKVPGIAILERSCDPESGDHTDTVIAEIGAIPPRFPEGGDWTMRLN